MPRPKQLTDSDKFFLQNHINNDPAELARSVRCTQAVVEAYLDEIKAGKVEMPSFDKAIAKKVRNNVVVATVMTEGASQIADAARETTANLRNPNFIHSCKPSK